MGIGDRICYHFMESDLELFCVFKPLVTEKIPTQVAEVVTTTMIFKNNVDFH